MRRHVHYCSRCGDAIYTCHEPPIVDDCGAHCPNDPEHGKEYCADCCVSLEDEVNAAMHDDDQAATDAWQEGR